MVLFLPVLFFTGMVAGAEKERFDLATVGYLQIQTPVDGARVYLDQVFMGFIQNGSLTIPIDVLATPRYSDLIIEYTGYQTFIGPVPDLVAGKTVGVKVELNKTGYDRMGIISFECGVAGAELSLNGEKMGTTPDSGSLLIQTVPAGLYEFKVKRPGNLTITQQQYVSANALTVYRVKLEPALTGEVQVNTSPEGAGIYLNNRYMGLSPLTIPDVPVGNQAVKITREGYQDWAGESIIVGAGSDKIDAVLVSLPPSPTPTCPEETPEQVPIPQPEDNSALYGVFVLVVILVLCCIVLGVWAFRGQKK